jgi:hypothetical protein
LGLLVGLGRDAGCHYCDATEESEGLEAFFTGGYRRVGLENVGHFPNAKHRCWSPMPFSIIFTKNPQATFS